MMATNENHNIDLSDHEVTFRLRQDDTDTHTVDTDKGHEHFVDMQGSATDTEPESESETLYRPVTVNHRRRTRRSSETRSVLEGLQGALRDLVTEVKDIRSGQTQLERRIEQVQNKETENSRHTEAQTVYSGSRLNANSQPFVSRNRENITDNNGNFSCYSQGTQDPRNAGDQGRMHYNLYTNDNACNEFFRPRPKDLIKVPPFDGKEEWRVWITRFETIADRLHWDEELRLDHLLQRLEGQAATVAFTLLPPAVLHNYRELKAELSSRFQMVETSRLFESRFARRNQYHDESVEVFAAELKMLYDRAHPHRDRRTREEDLVRRFLDGLQDEEARFEVEFHKEPTTVDEAVFNVATYLQMRGKQEDRRYRRPARRTTEQGGESLPEGSSQGRQWRAAKEGKSFSNNKPTRQGDKTSDEVLLKILKRLDDLESKYESSNREKSGRKREIVCYRCQQKGHFARECPGVERTGRQLPSHEVRSAPLNYQGPALAAKGRSQ